MSIHAAISKPVYTNPRERGKEMGVWDQALKMKRDMDREAAIEEARVSQFNAHMNSPHAIEWRQNVLSNGLGTTDDVLPPTPTQKDAAPTR